MQLQSQPADINIIASITFRTILKKIHPSSHKTPQLPCFDSFFKFKIVVLFLLLA